MDDEPLIRWSLCTALAAAGFEPVPAADGGEARRIAAEWPPPRVAIIDSRAVGTGEEEDLLARIRDVYPDCRFLIMTTARDGGAAGARSGVTVIEKPFDLAGIVGIVRDLAGASDAEAEADALPETPGEAQDDQQPAALPRPGGASD